MNFFIDITKEGSYLISIVLLFIFYLCPAPCSSECEISNEVQTITEENLLTSEVLRWNNESLLNKYCYFEIGKKYLKLFEANKSQSTLNKAILYLEYASKQLTIRDSEYTECLNLLGEAFFYVIPLDCDQLIKYKKRNQGINITQNDRMRKNFQNAVQPTIEKYINDPFNSVYPEQFIVKVNIILQMYNIKIDMDVTSVKNIHQLVKDYKSQLENLKNNPSAQQVNTIVAILDSFSSMGVKNVPKSNALRASQQYHQLYKQSLQQKNSSQACELLNSALNHLNTARNTFPFLTDSLNVSCHKPFACLLDEINIQSLMPVERNVSQYAKYLDDCKSYKDRYNTAKSRCPNVKSIFNYPKELDDLIAFYYAYNSLNESLDAFVGFLGNIRNDQLINAIKSNETVKQRIKELAYNTIQKYKNDPFNMEYPKKLATHIELFSQYNIHINANNLQQVHQLVIDYNTQLINLQTNQSVQQVEKIIASLDNFSKMDLQNVPNSNALRSLQQYHKSYTKSLIPEHRNQACDLLNSALSYLNTAQNSFPFLTDSLNINCHKPLACIFDEIDIQALLPDKENENQYAKNLKSCEQYLARYNKSRSQCPNIQPKFQFATQLEDLIKFYKGYNSLTADTQENLHPTDMLSNFMNNIQNNSKPYARRLYYLAGFYIANYYYQKSYKRLSEGPGLNRDETLKQIKIINDKLNINKVYIDMRVDVFNQYSKILEFLNSYQDKPVSEIKTIFSEIDQNIRKAWGLGALLTSEIEKRKQEELAIQKKMQQEALEKKKQHEAVERKSQREKFERKKPQDHLHIKEMKKDYNKNILDEALRKFNQTDYLQAWKLYGKVYHSLNSDSISKLLDDFNKYPPDNLIINMDENHRSPIQILCEIMHMKHFSSPPSYINYLLRQKKRYDKKYSWHIKMLYSSDRERNSNQKFFYGLYYYIVKPDTQNSEQMLNHFIAAYVNLKHMIRPPENKMKRVKFWLKKAWNFCDSKIKQKIINQHEFPEIFGTYLKLENEKDVKVASYTEFTISDFEKFASLFQESYEELSCEYIQSLFPIANKDNANECLKQLTTQIKKNNVANEINFSFRFFFAYSRIRKAQKDYENWIENLFIAYDSIPKDVHQTDRQKEVKKELALAKMYMNNSALNRKNTRYLRNVGLLNEWRKNDFIQEYLDIDVFSNYNEAKNAFEDIDCTVKYGEKTPKLQKLLYTFRMETNNEIRREYIALFDQFIVSCINKKEKKFWADLFWR